MSDKAVDLRLWSDIDTDQILSLFRSELGDHVASYPDYFDWLYCRNPAGRGTICCGQLTDGTVVAFYAVVPIPVICRGTSVVGSLSLQTLTHSDFRGQGLFPRCAEIVYNELKKTGVALTYGFPNQNSYRGFVQKLAFADIGRASLLIRPYDPLALLSSRFAAVQKLNFGHLDRAIIRGVLKKPKQSIKVESISSFEGLPVGRLDEKVKLVLDTDIDWLNWRYLEIPRREYRLVAAGDTNGWLGVAVFRITTWDDVKIGTLNDLFLAPNCGFEVLESLMHQVFSECEENGCAATLCLVSPGSGRFELLKHAGFWLVPSRFEPQPFPVILRGHTVEVSDITIADMEVSFGIYDVF